MHVFACGARRKHVNLELCTKTTSWWCVTRKIPVEIHNNTVYSPTTVKTIACPIGGVVPTWHS